MSTTRRRRRVSSDDNGEKKASLRRQATAPKAESWVIDRPATFEIVVGQETYRPAEYCSFTVGPLSMKITAEAGEDLTILINAGYARLNAQLEAEFQYKMPRALERIGELQDAKRQKRRSR